jgi:hypothetical protein
VWDEVIYLKNECRGCGKEHLECGNIEHYEIETPMLDEFGYR